MERCHASAQALGEGVVNAGLHVEPVGGRAGLAGIAHLGDHGAFKGGLQISVIKDDERSVPAKFHGGDDVLRSLGQEQSSHTGRAGERQLAHARIGQHGRGQRSRI